MCSNNSESWSFPGVGLSPQSQLPTSRVDREDSELLFHSDVKKPKKGKIEDRR